MREVFNCFYLCFPRSEILSSVVDMIARTTAPVMLLTCGLIELSLEEKWKCGTSLNALGMGGTTRRMIDRYDAVGSPR